MSRYIDRDELRKWVKGEIKADKRCEEDECNN